MRSLVGPAEQREVEPDFFAEGTARPAHIPREIFDAAARAYVEGRTIHMGRLADELGMSRATLYRRAHGRDLLLGEVIWYFTRRGLGHALRRADGLRGTKRVMAILERFVRLVHDETPLRRLLEEEPEAALRILTSRHGFVQRGVVAFFERVLEESGPESALRPADLAYLIVRVGESFLYADVIADGEPDVDKAVTALAQLLLPQRQSV